MEVNKRKGYVEIEYKGEIIPIKFGLYALELFCNEHKIKLSEIRTLFDENFIPNDLLKFLTIAMRSGANYAAEVQGKGEDYYSKFQVYEWLDEIGISSKQAQKIVRAFASAIIVGKFVEDEDDVIEDEDEPTVKKKKSTSIG